MIFPEAFFPKERYLDAHLPALTDIIKLVNSNNEIMSYIDRCLDTFFSFVRRGRQVAGVELRHLAGQPGGGGD